MKKFLLALAILSIFDVDCAKKSRSSSSSSKQTVYKKTKQKKAVNSASKSEKDPLFGAKQAVLVDFDSGERLYELNADEKCAPSSMTKLMTVYILFSAIKNERLRMNDTLPVSEEAQKMEGSRSFFKAGTTARVEDLVRSIIVHSGNDACVIVAEGLSGSAELFAEEMNQKAQELGLKNTHFTNPAGLPDEEHYSTVADLAIIAQRLIKDFPEYYHYFSEKVFTVNGITQQNRNTLLGNSMEVDGLKTGHTNAGGYGLVASTAKDGKRLISVVNGCGSTKFRAQASNKLLTSGYRDFVKFKPIKAGIPVTTLNVWLGDRDEINVCTHEDVNIIVPKKFRDSFVVEAKMREPIDAPIKLGQKVGDMTYRYGNFVSKKYELFSCEEVRQADWFKRAKLSLNYLIFGNSSSDEARMKIIKYATSAEENTNDAAVKKTTAVRQ